tara:strand:- start:324 stop:740 length:417 start_codon:yes stop_codon:yes gene_type:complete
MDTKEQFIKQIVQNLKNNGFPEKKVSLPLEKMYEIADSKGLSFNEVLKVIKDEHGIESLLETERVIFSNANNATQEKPFSFNPEELKNMDQDELKEKAQNFMKSMSPEQMAEIQKTFANMSQEEKDEIMRKGKEMGLL